MIKIAFEEKNLSRSATLIGQLGGKPNLYRPVVYPKCTICDNNLAYYFTLNLDTVCKDTYCSVFYCIKCTGNTVPMLPENLHLPVSAEECQALQREYRVFLHKNEIWSGEIFSPLIPSSIHGAVSQTEKFSQSHIGGIPSDKELIDSKCGTFLFQIRETRGLKFPTVPGSPNQQAYILFSDDEEFPERGYYTLVNEIPLYFYSSCSESGEMCGFLITGRF